MDDLQEVLTMLRKLLEQTHECEVNYGKQMPAVDALEWAISEVNAMISRRGQTPAAPPRPR